VFFFRESIIIYIHHTRIPEGCAITLLQQIHLTLKDAPLHRYRKYTRLLGEFIFFGLVDLSSSALDISSLAQWIYFLRLSGFIFFGSVDLSSSAF
jgi:hypothetical protein